MTSFVNIAFVAALLLFTRQCERDEIADVPDCIIEKIGEISKQDARNPPAKVYRYVYAGKTVYFIRQHCCDIPSQLFDADCNLLCSPDGGFTGRGDGKCADFFTSRTDEKLLWQDPRD